MLVSSSGSKQFYNKIIEPVCKGKILFIRNDIPNKFIFFYYINIKHLIYMIKNNIACILL